MYSERIYTSWSSVQNAKYEFLLSKLGTGFFSGKRIADIGCGPCSFGRFLMSKGIKASVIGTDVSLAHLIEGRPLPAALARGAPLKPVFDVALALDSLHLFSVDWPLRKGGHAVAGLFFRSDNFEERRKLLHDRLQALEIKKELVMEGRENEIFVIGRRL